MFLSSQDCKGYTKGYRSIGQRVHSNTGLSSFDCDRLLAYGLAGKVWRHRYVDEAGRKGPGETWNLFGITTYKKRIALVELFFFIKARQKCVIVASFD